MGPGFESQRNHQKTLSRNYAGFFILEILFYSSQARVAKLVDAPS